VSAQAVRALLVEDNPGDARLLREALADLPEAAVQVTCVASLAGCLASLESEAADIVLLDLGLPDADGLDGISAVRSAAPQTPLVVLTGLDDERAAIEAVRSGAEDYLVKSRVDGRVLWRVMRYAIERRQTQQAMRQSQKMEALGRLAGGVAHDFNNLLTVIIGCAELLRDGLAPDDPARDDADEILHTAERAADLTSQMLAFSRRQVLKPVVLDMVDVVVPMQKMLRRLIGEHIRVDFREPDAPCCVMADRTHIEQVLVNLVVNARDAMPDGGQLTVTIARQDWNENAVAMTDSPPPGRYVILTVADTGRGMDEATRSRLFEPFFTTKEQGKGTGLGLATVYGIVRQSGGDILVQSELGQGTTFRVLLPDISEQADTQTVAPSATLTAPACGSVLVVEDEDSVRNLTARILRSQGYEVLTARNASQAAQIMADLDSPVDLLLTDVVMPGQSGAELAGDMLALYPDIKVLLMSGFTDASIANGSPAENMPLLQKPFSRAELLKRTAQALEDK